MKITEKDLDSAILSKLNQLEGLKKESDSTLPDGFIVYGKNGFYTKRIPEIQLRTVCSNMDIAGLKSAIDHPTQFDVSSKYVDIRESGKHHISELSFKRDILESELSEIKLDAKVVKEKHLFGDLYLLLENGELVEFVDNKKVKNRYPLLDKIVDNFNLRGKLFINDIVDFDMLGCVFFIATRSNGIYTYNTAKDEVVLFISEPRIRTMDLARNDSLFVTTDSECLFYDIINGAIIERYRTLYNKYQLPLFTKVTDDYIFVVGEAYSSAPTDQYLHAWKLDDSRLSYKLVDGMIPRNRRILGGMISDYSSVYNDMYLVLKGFEGNYILHYDEQLKLSEMPFDFSTDMFLQVNPNEYLFIDGNLLYHIKDEKIEKLNFNVGSARFLGILYGNFYIIVDDRIYFFNLNKLLDEPATLKYRVYDADDTCNNIEILVDGDNIKDITLLDDADIIIRPSYKVIIGSLTYIKLVNCKVTKIFMNVSVDGTSVINGIVCRSNKLYLR